MIISGLCNNKVGPSKFRRYGTSLLLIDQIFHFNKVPYKLSH